MEAALDYAKQGWRVFPLHHLLETGNCSCQGKGKHCSPGKHPRLNRGLKGASADENRIRGWWKKWPQANVAIVTGATSGIVVVDVDPYRGGDESLKILTELHGALPNTLQSSTGRGRHYFFGHPGGRVRNRSGADGIDIRGDGGYVVAPPSVHQNGISYKWQGPPFPYNLPILPPFFSMIDTEHREHREQSEQLKQHDAIRDLTAIPAIQKAIIETQPTDAGHRNHKIWHLARKLKAVPEASDASFIELKPVVREWHARALRIIATKPFDDTWADFTTAWSNVKVPGDKTVLDACLAQADAAPNPPIAQLYDSDLTQRLIRFCFALQAFSGDAPFYLSCRSAAAKLRTDYKKAAQRLKMLCDDGVLEVSEMHTKTRAIRYRIAGAVMAEDSKSGDAQQQPDSQCGQAASSGIRSA
jgi:hypothetical protein